MPLFKLLAIRHWSLAKQSKDQRPKTKDQTGFTLIEVLVTLAILALVTIITIPNFHNFNDSQTNMNSVNSLISTLHAAQTNAQSGAICPTSGTTSAMNYWAVTLTSTGYALWAACTNGSTGNTTYEPSPLAQQSLASTLTITSPPTPFVVNDPAYSSCFVEFQGNNITASAGCGASAFTGTGLFQIQINKSGSPYNYINILKGGAIYAAN